MRCVTWGASPWGYEVTVWADISNGEEEEVYRAGNNIRSSYPGNSVSPSSRHAEDLDTLRQYAKDTAQDMANEHGIPLENVWEDEDYAQREADMMEEE